MLGDARACSRQSKYEIYDGTFSFLINQHQMEKVVLINTPKSFNHISDKYNNVLIVLSKKEHNLSPKTQH